jgi:hypothetical protein
LTAGKWAVDTYKFLLTVFTLFYRVLYVIGFPNLPQEEIMTESLTSAEIADRLKLIETMMTEGRRQTEGWGWTFVLWGIAYFVAIFWSGWWQILLDQPLSPLPGSHWAWLVTMFGTAALTLIIGLNMDKGKTRSAAGRTVASVWSGIGFSMIVIFPALGAAGRLDTQLFVALVAVLLGGINATSGMILRWKAQIACAIVWWATSVTACFGSERQLLLVFLAALFVCQIVFGIYAMLRDARARNREARHA